MSDKPSILEEPADFSLVLGGPLYQLFLRTRLVKPPLELAVRRIIGIPLLAWLPLLLLTTLAGQALGGVAVPFLLDLDAQLRFLGSLPLLIGAELIVHARLRVVVREFLDRGLIAPEDRSRLEGIVASAMRLRNSVILELLLLVLVFTGGHWLWSEHLTLDAATWYAVKTEGHAQLTPAGYWYAFVSLPIVRFIGFRWYFRLFIWYRFLWQVSRLKLRLNPLHPDRAGGLGFLDLSMYAFVPVLLAHTVLLSGVIGNRIWHVGAALPDFKLEIAGILLFLLLLVLAPLTFFFFQLAEAKRTGLREYGLLASQYVAAFRDRWITGQAPEKEALLGSADIQSLADLSNSYDVVHEMHLVPFSRHNIVQIALLSAVPLAPLALTMIPLEQMIDRALGIFL